MHSYDELGLYSDVGSFDALYEGDLLYKGEELKCSSLEEMNDGGYTWPQIAEFIRENPKVVFSKSV